MFRFLHTAIASATCISIIIAPVNSRAQMPALRDPCMANMIGTLGEPDHIYTEGLVFENVPPQLLAFATSPHTTRTYTLTAIPLADEEFKAVFKTDFISGDDAAQVSQARRYADLDKLTATDSIRGRPDFQSFMNKADGQFVILAGHNENGKFVFYGGEAVAIPLLAEDCARAVKICVFISCKSKDYVKEGSVGVSRDLTLAEGIWMATKTRQWLAQQQNVSVVQLSAYIRTIELQGSMRFHSSYLVMAACATAGTPAVAYLIINGAQPAASQQRQ
jgi:hypothetical protein